MQKIHRIIMTPKQFLKINGEGSLRNHDALQRDFKNWIQHHYGERFEFKLNRRKFTATRTVPFAYYDKLPPTDPALLNMDNFLFSHVRGYGDSKITRACTILVRCFVDRNTTLEKFLYTNPKTLTKNSIDYGPKLHKRLCARFREIGFNTNDYPVFNID